jgi:hypothetical protein
LWHKVNQEGQAVKQSYTHILSQCWVEKKKNIDASNAMVYMLAQIPGMSVTMAQAIQERFPSLVALSQYCASVDRTVKKNVASELADIKFGPSQRRIGPAVATRLVSFVTGS